MDNRHQSHIYSPLNGGNHLPKILRDIVLQFAFHQMTKQRLDLVEDAVVRIIGFILQGEQSLDDRKKKEFRNTIGEAIADIPCTKPKPSGDENCMRGQITHNMVI